MKRRESDESMETKGSSEQSEKHRREYERNSKCLAEKLFNIFVESESRSLEESSAEVDTKFMTTSNSCRCCRLFYSSESSVDVEVREVYRQLVVEKIIDCDITTAFKLCCIGHQFPFCREIINDNLPISDEQTLRESFDQMVRGRAHII